MRNERLFFVKQIQDTSRIGEHFTVMNIELKENRFKIFIALLIAIIFTLSIIGFLWIFTQPLWDRLLDLRLNEIILFGGFSVLCFCGLCLLLISIVFMLFKIFIPAKITITKEGISGRTTNGIVLWNQIETIDYLAIRKHWQALIVVLGVIISFANISALIYFLRALLLLDNNDIPSIIRLHLKDETQILLDIDEIFVDGSYSVLDIIKTYKTAEVRGSYYLKSKLQELGL